MYKFVVLVAIVATASAAPPLLATVGVAVGAPQAIAPATIVDSPAGAVANTVVNQIANGVTGLNAGLATTAGLVVPVGATVVHAAPAVVAASPVLVAAGPALLAHARGPANPGNLAVANHGLLGGKVAHAILL